MKIPIEFFDDYQRQPNQLTLTRLLQAYQGAVYNCCYQVLQHHQNAQDSAQEVFIKILDNMPKISDAQHFQRWVYRVSFNTALDFRRKNMRFSQNQEKYQKEVEANPLVQASMEETSQIVHEHLNELDDELRYLVVQHYFEKRTLKEIAEEEGVTTSAIWQKIQNALEKVRGSMARAGFASAVPFLLPYLDSIQPVGLPLPLSTGLEGVAGKASAKMVASTGSKLTGAAILGGSVLKKTWLIAGTAILVLGGASYFLSMPKQSSSQSSITSPKTDLAKASSSPASPDIAPDPKESMKVKSSSMTKSDLVSDDFPKFKSMSEFDAVGWQVMLISDDAERLQAFRSRLGVKISDKAFLETLAQIKPTTGKPFVRFLRAWFKEDPEAGNAWASRLPLSEKEISQFEQLMNLRNEQLPLQENFLEKLKQARGIRDEMERGLMTRGAITEWSQESPEEALEYALTIPKEEEHGATRSMSISAAFDSWTKLDPDNALAWVKNLTDEKQRQELLPTAIIGWAKIHPDQPLDLSFLPASDQKTVLQGVISDWAFKSPEAASKYAQSFTDKELREAGLCSVSKVWVVKDPDAAVNWAEQLPQGADKNSALAPIVQTIGKYDIPKALNLADEITDQKLKNNTIYNVVLWGGKGDPKAGFAAMEKLSKIQILEISQILSLWAVKADPVTARKLVEKLHSEGKIDYSPLEAEDKKQKEKMYRDLLKSIPQ